MHNDAIYYFYQLKQVDLITVFFKKIFELTVRIPVDVPSFHKLQLNSQLRRLPQYKQQFIAERGFAGFFQFRDWGLQIPTCSGTQHYNLGGIFIAQFPMSCTFQTVPYSHYINRKRQSPAFLERWFHRTLSVGVVLGSLSSLK